MMARLLSEANYRIMEIEDWHIFCSPFGVVLSSFLHSIFRAGGLDASYSNQAWSTPEGANSWKANNGACCRGPRPEALLFGSMDLQDRTRGDADSGGRRRLRRAAAGAVG